MKASSPRSPARLTTLDWWIVAVITALGAVAPLRHFASGRSLWGDEAALALNILTRDVAALLGPLDHLQIAPFLFLVLTKGVTVLLDSIDERVLRLLPLCGALATGPLVYVTAFALRGRLTAALAAGLTVLAPSLIYFAAELKPYSTDAFASALLLFLAARCVERPSSRRHVFEFVGVASVLVTLSFPAILVAASALAVLTVGALGRDRLFATFIVLSALPLAAVSGLTLWLARPSPQTDAYMDAFWHDAFLRFPPGGPYDLKDSLHVIVNAFDAALTDRALLLVLPAGLLALGLWLPAALGFRLEPQAALLLVCPWLVAILASRLSLYPLAGRLALYLLPTITIGVASTLAGIADDRASSPRILVAVALVGTLSLNALLVVRDSIERDELAPVVRAVGMARRAGERVYVYYGARPAFDYYRRRTAESWSADVIAGSVNRGDATKYVEEIEEAARDSQTVWLLFSRVYVPPLTGGLDERTAILNGLSPGWSVARTIDHTGASAVLLRRR